MAVEENSLLCQIGGPFAAPSASSDVFNPTYKEATKTNINDMKTKITFRNVNTVVIS